MTLPVKAPPLGPMKAAIVQPRRQATLPPLEASVVEAPASEPDSWRSLTMGRLQAAHLAAALVAERVAEA